MGHRITASAWAYMKKHFAEDIENMVTFSVSLDRCNIFPSHARIYKTRRRNSNRKKARDKTNTEQYGIELGPMFDWLNENTNDQYYAELAKQQGTVREAMINFYFMDETDAMAFKLVFSEKSLTNK